MKNVDHPKSISEKLEYTNLGTPDSTSWWDIRKYLKNFCQIEES